MPSSRVFFSKKGVMYCTPYSTGICVLGVVEHMRRKGLYERGKLAMSSSRDLGGVP